VVNGEYSHREHFVIFLFLSVNFVANVANIDVEMLWLRMLIKILLSFIHYTLYTIVLHSTIILNDKI
jgi:hypothetical protein